MFMSALPPRNSGRVTTKPCSPCTPQPIVPTPGIRLNQFVKRMRMKIVAKNQNVLLTRSEPMIPSRKSWRLSTNHSQKFCAPVGTSRILLVARRANKISPKATTQVITIELVIKNSSLKSGSAFCGMPCSACSAWPALVPVASAAALAESAGACSAAGSNSGAVNNSSAVRNDFINDIGLNAAFRGHPSRCSNTTC